MEHHHNIETVVLNIILQYFQLKREVQYKAAKMLLLKWSEEQSCIKVPHLSECTCTNALF